MKCLLSAKLCRLFVVLGSAFCSVAAVPSPQNTDQIEFFESEIRPLLVNHCYSCHSAQAATIFKGLLLDSREGMVRGGESGPAIIPGKPHESGLIQRIQGKPILMPPTGALQDTQIGALIRWVEMGAPWPDETTREVGSPSAVFDLQERKKSHWAWQPVKVMEPPAVSRSWPIRSLDNFILAKLGENGLKPASAADRHTLIRRLSFDLRGLPPTAWEVQAFVDDTSPKAYEKVVDRFLKSSRFGERWARHWMDLFRYSESHGSEGDPDTPLAWRYRDYLIRAFNSDVPYDQLILEHLAGDLLPTPRINKRDRINESLIATAHFRMVEHAFQPVDPWEDRVKWTDNQIDVISKTFQGLTVSCARCHDHKFDAISQKDYYALFGILYGARPTQRVIDDPEVFRTHRDRLVEIKKSIRGQLAETWLQSVEPLLSKSLDSFEELDTVGKESPLHAWVDLAGKQGEDFSRSWSKLVDYWRTEIIRRQTFNRENFETWDLTSPDYDNSTGHGTGFSKESSKPGEFWILNSGDRVLNGIYPGGVYTNLLSTKHSGVIQSPRFKVETDRISLRLLGGDLSFAQLIIENYAVPRSGIYHLRHSPKQDRMKWVQWDTSFWKGFTAYIEFATRDDVTRFGYDPIDSKSKLRPQPGQDGRSWIGASRIAFHNNEEPPQEVVVPILHLLEGKTPNSHQELARLMESALREVIFTWRDGHLSERQAAFLDDFVRRDLLPRSLGELSSVRSLVAEFRSLEGEVPIAQRAPGVIEEGAPDQPLLIRGSHKNPGEIVPRRFLTALGSTPYNNPKQVRLRLAQEITSPKNPLTARVLINRVWRFLFGYGIVRTVDNFGRLGEEPSHPEMMDYLADRFVKDGYSIKKLIRLLVTSQTYRMSSRASPRAEEIDPANRLLQHASIRRLDAEAIRDSMLVVSGRFDSTMFGPSISVYYPYAKGKTKGDKEKGPLDGEGRRSIYQEIRRNTHNPFLEVFDLPKPASTRGQRDSTNVPAQSLTLLNSPFVIGQAAVWGTRLAEGEAYSTGSRIEHMFLKALGRKPLAEELERAEVYLSSLVKEHGASQVLAHSQVWQDFAHSIFNLKEFVYIQ